MPLTAEAFARKAAILSAVYGLELRKLVPLLAVSALESLARITAAESAALYQLLSTGDVADASCIERHRWQLPLLSNGAVSLRPFSRLTSPRRPDSAVTCRPGTRAAGRTSGNYAVDPVKGASMSVARFSTLLLCASLALSGCNPQTPPGVTPTPGPSVIPSEPPALREVNGPWNQTKLPLTERQQRVMGNLLSATLTMTAFERRGNSDLLLLSAGSDASAGPNALDAAREGQRGASISPGSFKQQFKQVANSDGTTTATITRSVYSFPYYYGETIAYTPSANIWHVPGTFTHRQDYGTDQVGSARTTERVTSSMPYGGGTSVYLLPEHHEVMTDPKQRPTIRFELKEGTEATGTITFASGFKGTFSRSRQDERGFIVEGENLKLVGRYDDKDQPVADVFLDGAKIGTVPLQYPSMLPPATPSPSPGP